MSEKQFIPHGIEQKETERKGQALDWLLSRIAGGIDEVPNRNAPLNPEKVAGISEIISDDIDSEKTEERADVVKYYFYLAPEIGPSPSENPWVVEQISKLKKQIEGRPVTFELLRESADLRWLNELQISSMCFLDYLQGSLSVAAARIYYPERFKYLTEGFIETIDLSVDEIYSCYLDFLQKNIDFGRSRGYPDDQKGADGLGSYISIYKKLTENIEK